MSGPVTGKTYAAGEGPPGNWRSWLIWSSAALFYLYEFFVRVGPSVMEKDLQEVYGVSAGVFGFATGIYYYIYAPMQIAVGLLLDKLGVRRVLVPAALLCFLGCLLTILLPDIWGFGLGRALMGFGSAFAFVGCMHLATVWFPGNRVAMLAGLTTALGMTGAIFAQRPLVELYNAVGWHQTWTFCGGGGIAIAIVMWIVIPKPPPWVVPEDEEACTVWRGLKAVVKNPQSWIIGLIGAALFFNLSVFGALWGDEYVETLTGANDRTAASAISFLYVGWLVGGPVMGVISDRLGRRKPVLLVSLIATAAISAVMLTVSHMSLWECSALLLVLGLVSSAQIVCFVSSLEHNPDWASATAISFCNLVVMLIGGIFQPLVGWILDLRTGGAIHPAYTVDDFRVALLSMPVIALIGIVAAFFLKESYGIKEEALEALAED